MSKIHHAVIDGMSGAEILGALLDLTPEGRDTPAALPVPRGKPGQLEMLGRGLLGVPRYPMRLLGSVPRALPNVDEVQVAGRDPRAGHGRTRRPRRPAAPGPRPDRRARGHDAAPHFVQRARVRPSALRVRAARTRAHQADQERIRLHRQRRGRLDLRRRRPPLAAGARRATRRAAGGTDPGLGAQGGAARHLRQPDPADDRAAVHERRGPCRAADAHPRGAGADEGAPSGTPR